MNELLPKTPIGVLTSNRAHTTPEALQEFATYNVGIGFSDSYNRQSYF